MEFAYRADRGVFKGQWASHERLGQTFKQEHFAELDYFFQVGWMNALLKGGANQAQLDAAASALRISVLLISATAFSAYLALELRHQIKPNPV